MGAKLVTEAFDILETLNLQQAKDFKAAKLVSPETEQEKILLNFLDSPIHVDKLVQLVKLNISIVNANLAVMEMKGMVKNLVGQIYVKARWISQ